MQVIDPKHCIPSITLLWTPKTICFSKLLRVASLRIQGCKATQPSVYSGSTCIFIRLSSDFLAGKHDSASLCHLQLSLLFVFDRGLTSTQSVPATLECCCLHDSCSTSTTASTARSMDAQPTSQRNSKTLSGPLTHQQPCETLDIRRFLPPSAHSTDIQSAPPSTITLLLLTCS